MNEISATSISDEQRWEAVRLRNEVLDGTFVYAVRTTGIFCRPSCRHGNPSAKTRSSSHPRLKQKSRATERACEVIDTADQPPTLNELAATVGLIPSHLHREFKRLTGVTPREYAAGKRVARLQDGLAAGQPISDAIYAAGYGSGSRGNENAKRTLGMTPGQYRAGGKNLFINFTVVASVLGPLLVAATEQGVCCIEFGADEATLRASLTQLFPAARLEANDDRLREWVAQLTRSIETPGHALTLPLDIRGTVFQRRVWKVLQSLPAGRTASYGEVAAAIGQPLAHRAVGSACAA